MKGSWKWVLSVVSLCILGWSLTSVDADTDPSDVSALTVMYSSLNSPSQLTQWSSNGGDPCGQSWKGVKCSRSRVTEIDLSGLGLSGTLGYNLQSLTSLTNLDMSNNDLAGGIPYNLPPNLTRLHVPINSNFGGNQFTQGIPYSISMMTYLEYLNISHNQLQNTLDDVYGKLSSLATLDLSFNTMPGNLPESFSSLSSLKTLDLQNNQLTGTIDVLANLPLENLNIENNHFTGWVPAALKSINLKKDGNTWNSGPAPPPPPDYNVRKSKSRLWLWLGLGAAGLVIVLVAVCCFRTKLSDKSTFFRMNTDHSGKLVKGFMKDHGPLQVKRYKYLDVKKMTNSFKEKLGQGGYGGVYKGKLKDGRLVAVKVLNRTKGNGEDFMNEVAAISRTSHVNIVSLLGFCFEGSKRALIYEFMPNGSLEKFIFDARNQQEDLHLGWEALDRIALGIARGLEYLHRGCNTRILHFDIKPHNILLNEDFLPKIADFGLAKICNGKESIVSTMCARGTVGYIAPEVFCRSFGGVSHKCDVYSYGMMLSEMAGGRRNINAEAENTSEIYFPHWIYKRLELDEDLGLVSITNEEDKVRARKMIIVSLWCIQTNPSSRPSMKQVIEMLEGTVELEMPPKPYLSSPPRSPAHSSSSVTSASSRMIQ